MKICQIKEKNILFKNLKTFFSLFAIIFVLFSFLFINKTTVQAEVSLGGASVPQFDVSLDPTNIGVVAPQTNLEIIKSKMTQTMETIKNWAIQEALAQLKKSGDIAWRQALKFFLNTLAYDTATYLATGDKGQLPMFETKGFGGYLKDVADNTAGTFLEELGQNMGTLKFNLCTTNLDVMLKINLGLQRTYSPRKPACTFSEMTENWEAALKDKDFLPKFQDMFNPWSNDLGIALTLQTGMENEISQKINEAAQDRIEGNGWRPVRSAIDGRIKTPADIVGAAARQPIQDSTASEKIHTGTILADSFDIFINTLVGKLIDQWLKKGLVSSFNDTVSNLADPDAQNQNEGISGAESRLKALVEPNFKVRGDYDILAELTTCPDPNKAGPTNCVIDEKFRQAIEKRLTVGQALEQGYLNANGVFGFNSDGLEPKFNEGYPYRSMLILRKFRIIPVGWEVAAEKIKDQQAIVDGTKNLKSLVDCFSATGQWCFGLVDPDWVLKAPQNFCKKEGAGPEILSEQVTGQGADSSLSILRNDNYCADEQSCIKEKSDGSCQLYGYCTEERRKWDFNAKSCEPRNNTCQTFRGPDGYAVSYLENTLDFGVCNAGNAGCAKYATNGNYANGAVNWNIADNNPIYLNKNAESCESADEGCHGFIRITPGQSETYQTIEAVGVAQAYNRFGASGLIYEKLLPDYLQTACYDDMTTYYKLKDNAPVECNDFVRQCKKEEVGCELYTNATEGYKIPAKVGPTDYCPAECVGYDTFIQKETTFDSLRDAYFIPKTAKTCSAEAVGCDEFTNLEKVATTTPSVAEKKEYYTSLRQCVKPNTPGETCGEFYTWEGSDESGYQLKVESLKADGVGGPAGESVACTKEIYNYPLSNPAYNPDCRQFYNRDGNDFYRLYNLTISCADDCHPYRKTVAADDIIGVCNGGGVWSADNNACIYMAIPGQGVTCSAAQNGCREYTGNTGNDVRNIFTDDFEADLTTGDWKIASSLAPERVNESIILQNNVGHSMLVRTDAKRSVGSAVTEGKSYVLSFLVKAVGGATLNISLAAGVGGAEAAFNPVTVDDVGWQFKKINLTNLNHKITADEFLLIRGTSDFYIDNIVLTEIVDRYYLIKGSWNTPASCDQKPDGTPYVQYMLRCDKYADRGNKTHYLKSFSELCSESAVGCELMIDTKNSTTTTTEIFTNSGTTVTVPADSFIYAVYDREKQCNAGAKGCARLGQTYQYDGVTRYGDIYLENNPDEYKTILCGENAVGCESFAYNNGPSDSGDKNFKDPGDQVCEWRRATGQGDYMSWFKKKVKRCGSDSGDVCLSDADCSSNIKCLLETTDKPCPTDTNKTLGLGGVGGAVSQPGEENGVKWAGVCPASESGCGEYIDPVSKFNTNIIFNGNFVDLDNIASAIPDGWGAGIKQDVTLEPNTVYRLGRAAGAGSLILSNCPDALYLIDEHNNLVNPQTLAINDPGTSITVSAAGYANSKIFYYKGVAANCTITAGSSAGAVELKKAAIDYQLAENLDTKTCNGIVDFNKGCVLFNERSQDGASLKALDSDADITADGSAPVSGISGDRDSNIILKVAPDRTCDKWLACRSYIKDEKGNNTCFDVGLCDTVDENGNCNSFIKSPKANQTINTLGADKISNLSGYAKVGLAGGSLISDYYPLGAMKQAGEVANLSNGNFEFYGSNGYPIGWTWSGNRAWEANIFSTVDNPIAAQSEAIGYAPEGRAFLKLGSTYDATSEEVEVIPNTEYIITAYVNTKNLKSGAAKIDVISSAGALITPAVITQDLGYNWKFQVGKFTTAAGVARIKIKLYAEGVVGEPGSQGNFYFDDVKIRPALNSKDNWHTTQSCRLYPQSDSLSCDYYEDSGKRQKGWPGYCLEYDRAPGNPNTCLLWYPIDKVKGDGIEEGVGYLDKFPLYYCTDVEADVTKLPTTHYFYFTIDTNGNDNPDNWFYPAADMLVSPLSEDDLARFCGPGINDVSTNNGNTGYPSQATVQLYYEKWLEIAGVSANEYRLKNFQFYKTGGASCVNSSDSSSSVYKVNMTNLFYCNKIVQTVNSVGQNKYWSGRVYQGSNYSISCNADIPSAAGICGYEADQAPFGSVVPPYTSLSALYNPYEWDTRSAEGKQPLYYEANNGQPRMGQELPEASVKQLFAKTYGAWQWNNSQGCVGGANSGGACLSNADCQGTCNKVCVNTLTNTIAATTTPPGFTSCNSDTVDVDCGSSNSDCLPRVCSDTITPCSSDADCSGTCASVGYVSTDQPSWGPPGTNGEPSNGLCNGTGNSPRPANAYCAILPKVENIKVQGVTANVELKKNQFVNLTFTSKLDVEQQPLVMYGVDWGDGEKTIVSGIEMLARPNINNPHSLYHLYSYWDLKAKRATNQDDPATAENENTVYCADAGSNAAKNYNDAAQVNVLNPPSSNYCVIRPKIQIKDNWGWCNNGQQINVCGVNQWDSFNGLVIVTEK